MAWREWNERTLFLRRMCFLPLLFSAIAEAGNRVSGATKFYYFVNFSAAEILANNGFYGLDYAALLIAQWNEAE